MNNLIKRVEAITELKAKVKYVEKQKGDVRDTWADVNKAKKELRWMPRINIYTGLERYICISRGHHGGYAWERVVNIPNLR